MKEIGNYLLIFTEVQSTVKGVVAVVCHNSVDFSAIPNRKCKISHPQKVKSSLPSALEDICVNATMKETRRSNPTAVVPNVVLRKMRFHP